MDERTKQFKEAAESHLSNEQLTKEVNTLRKFLYRNQEFRFSKSAQLYIFMAIIAHHGNPAAHKMGGKEAPILGLLDDALKMPFTVITSSHKDKLLQLYWGILGETPKSSGAPAPPPEKREFGLLDVYLDGVVPQLTLMCDNGEEYPQPVECPMDAYKEIKREFDDGKEVRITVSECKGDDTVTFVEYAVE